MSEGRHGRSTSGPGSAALRALKGYSPNARVYAVLRHAQREEQLSATQNLPVELTPQLTPEGRESARLFGRELPRFANLFLASTPLPRARLTATEVMSGFMEISPGAHVVDEGIDPKLTPALYYSKNDAALDAMFKRSGVKAVLRSWLNDQIPRSFLPSANVAVNDFLNRAVESLEHGPPSTLRVGISHDLHIGFLRDGLLGNRFEEASEIGYLDGIVVEVLAPHSVAIRCGPVGREMSLDPPSTTGQLERRSG